MDDVARMAAGLTRAAKEELLHHSTEWRRPANFNRARRLWMGLKPLNCPYLFLLQRRHRACEYRLTPLGLAVRTYLEKDHG
jgi:hypothetical protein